MRNPFKCLWPDQPHKFLLLLFPCAFFFTMYFVFVSDLSYTSHPWNLQVYPNITFDQTTTGANYLVWSSKCHIPSINPHDPSIVEFVKKEKFETCSEKPKLTSISMKPNGSIYLLVDHDAAKHYKGLSCCWSAVTRPAATKDTDNTFDSKISVGPCRGFEDRVLLDVDVQVIYVSCRRHPKGRVQYENVHAVINPARAVRRETNDRTEQPLSVLVLGIDSVSRLNFHRSMPASRAYLDERGWTELRGYNKMGDNTFPNLMALLSGGNQSWAYAQCKPQTPYGMDNCPMIWRGFRDAGYATAYAEDLAGISTFNYLKVGFVEPPTDYYLRPYVLAAEKLLKARKRFGSQYCTGPELSVDRILDSALDFCRAFAGRPYFGFFWTNSISHDNVNGPSLYDEQFLAKLQRMESDSVIVLLSDHGMRVGDIRETLVGWHEDRLPFVYVWLPPRFRRQNPQSYAALRLNRDRLTSPYDLYETLRDVLQRAGGRAAASTGCPRCSSLLRPVARERSCEEAGIAPHWCACQAIESVSSSDPVVVEGARKFVEHLENVVQRYRDEKGNRLCSPLRLKRVIRASKMLDPAEGKVVLRLLYVLEVTPGGGKFETTVRYNGPGDYTIRDDEVSRINLYGDSSWCLSKGLKQYCRCISPWDRIFGKLFDG